MEVSDGFEKTDITIKKLNEPVDIKATTTITADQTIGGSTDLGWAIKKQKMGKIVLEIKLLALIKTTMLMF